MSACPYCGAAKAEPAFGPGDLVVCVDSWDSFRQLTVGATYQVSAVHPRWPDLIRPEGHMGFWDSRRFEPAPTPVLEGK